VFVKFSTTEIYTHINKENLLKAVESNPLAQVKKKNKSL
jgi:site-specific recombinase XerD